jgi:hypothetical protein
MSKTRCYNNYAVPILKYTRKIILQFKHMEKRNNKRHNLKLHSDKNKITQRKAIE